MGFSELLCFIFFGFIFLTSTPKMCIKTPLPGKGIWVFFSSFLWAPQLGVIELLGDCKRLCVSVCSPFSLRFKPSMMSWIGVARYCGSPPPSPLFPLCTNIASERRYRETWESDLVIDITKSIMQTDFSHSRCLGLKKESSSRKWIKSPKIDKTSF